MRKQVQLCLTDSQLSPISSGNPELAQVLARYLPWKIPFPVFHCMSDQKKKHEGKVNLTSRDVNMTHWEIRHG